MSHLHTHTEHYGFPSLPWVCVILGLAYGLMEHNHDAKSIIFWVFIAHIILLCVILVLFAITVLKVYIQQRRDNRQRPPRFSIQ